MSRAGAHAGRLHPEEQFVFAMVFALMAGFVVVITMSAVRSSMNSLLAERAAAASSQTIPAGTGAIRGRAEPTRTGGRTIQAASPRLNAALAAAMGPVLSAHPGQLAVGLIDETTGQQALYASTRRFASGDIIRADILAALLIRQQRVGTSVTADQAVLAKAMMDRGSAAATSVLWRDVGKGNGLASANRLLKLRRTIPGAGDHWDQTTTTAGDQLQLLVDLTSSHSPLTALGRAYMMRMLGAEGTQPRWGVSAAGNGNAVQGGWLPEGPQWVTNSVGVVEHAGHVLLVVVLSSGSTSQVAGASLVSAAAVAAADLMAHAGH